MIISQVCKCTITNYSQLQTARVLIILYEYGSFFVLQLDDKPVQHREVMNYESDLFKDYFDDLTFMEGG